MQTGDDWDREVHREFDNTGRLCVDIKLAAILVQSSLWLMRRSRSGRGRPQLFEFLACAAGKIGGAYEARSSMFISLLGATGQPVRLVL